MPRLENVVSIRTPPMADVTATSGSTVTTKKAIYAEDILEALFVFYQDQRSSAVSEKKLWPRTMQTPQMGAVGQERAPKTVDVSLLTVAPTNRISLRDMLEYSAHVMFKDYYSSNVLPASGRQVKYPEVFNVLKKGTNLPLMKDAFGRKFEKVRAKLTNDLTRAGTVASAYEYYNAFLLESANFYASVTTTPAAWADKVKALTQAYETPKPATVDLVPAPVDPPALALDSTTTTVVEKPSEKDLEAYAKAGATSANQSSWFWRMLGY